MKFRTRYQGAIMRDHNILLIRHTNHGDGRAYWLVPGGGREQGETEEECVQREMREETGLEVRVERLLLDEESLPGEKVYDRIKTYLCIPEPGEARPGYEPEPHVAAIYAITAVRWVDLRDPQSWGPEVEADRFTYPLLLKLRAMDAQGALLC